MKKYFYLSFSIAAFIIAGNALASLSGITEQVSKIFYWPSEGVVAGESIVRMAQVGAVHPYFIANQSDFDRVSGYISAATRFTTDYAWTWQDQFNLLMSQANGIPYEPDVWDTSMDWNEFKSKADQGSTRLARLSLAYILSGDVNIYNKAEHHLLLWTNEATMRYVDATFTGWNHSHPADSVVINVALAYDLLYNNAGFTAGEKQQVLNWLNDEDGDDADDAVKYIKERHELNNNLSNQKAWDDLALILSGLALDDTALVNYAVNGAANGTNTSYLINQMVGSNGNICDYYYACNEIWHNLLTLNAFSLTSTVAARNGYENLFSTAPKLSLSYSFYAPLYQTNDLNALGASFYNDHWNHDCEDNGDGTFGSGSYPNQNDCIADPATVNADWLAYSGVYEIAYYAMNTGLLSSNPSVVPTITDPNFNMNYGRYCDNSRNQCDRWIKYPTLVLGLDLSGGPACSCIAWTDQPGCGATCGGRTCASTEICQTRTCTPAACAVETQCASSVACGAPPPVCGDGSVNQASEQCDDGNADNCDACHNDCTNNTGCGDGDICSPEQCDDGNIIAGDGCSSTCQIEGGGGTGFEWCNSENSLCKMGLGRAPAVAMDTTGKIHITYDCGRNFSSSFYPDYDVDYPRAGSSVCYRTWSCAGGISAEQKIGAGWGSRVAVDSHNRAHIVYQIMGSTGWDAIGYNQVDSAGQARFGTGGATLITMDGRIDKPRIAVNHADRVFVSYSDETGGWKVAFVDFDSDTGPFSYSSRQGTTVHTGSKLSNGGIAVDGNDDVHFQWSVFDAGAGLWYGRVNGGIGNPVDVHNASNESASNFSDISAQWAGDNVSGAGEMGWGFGLYYLWGTNSLTNVTKILENTVSNPNEVGPQHIDGDYLQTDIIVDARGTPYLTWTGYRNKHNGQDLMAYWCEDTSPGGPHGAGSEDVVRDCASQCRIDPVAGGTPDNCQEMRWPIAYYVTMGANGSVNPPGPILVVNDTTSVAAGQPQMSTRSRQGSKWTNPQSAAANNQGIITAFEYAVPDEPYNIFFKMIDGANICAQPVCDYNTICEPPLETVANCTDCITPPVCGNKKIETGEQCDDGNTISGDGCSSTCQLEHCDPNLNCDAMPDGKPKVDVFDLALLMYYWDGNNVTPTPDTACGKNADFNADKLVDVGDLGWMATCWGSPMLPACVNNCPSPAAAATVQ